MGAIVQADAEDLGWLDGDKPLRHIDRGPGRLQAGERRFPAKQFGATVGLCGDPLRAARGINTSSDPHPSSSAVAQAGIIADRGR